MMPRSLMRNMTGKCYWKNGFGVESARMEARGYRQMSDLSWGRSCFKVLHSLLSSVDNSMY